MLSLLLCSFIFSILLRVCVCVCSRMLGNIRFMGELYLKRMLLENIMYFIIAKLIGDAEHPDEEDIEAATHHELQVLFI